MTNEIEEIIEKIESKKRDCVSFSKKYKQREMDDLYQYYEGANWALEFTLKIIQNINEKNPNS